MINHDIPKILILELGINNNKFQFSLVTYMKVVISVQGEDIGADAAFSLRLTMNSLQELFWNSFSNEIRPSTFLCPFFMNDHRSNTLAFLLFASRFFMPSIASISYPLQDRQTNPNLCPPTISAFNTASIVTVLTSYLQSAFLLVVVAGTISAAPVSMFRMASSAVPDTSVTAALYTLTMCYRSFRYTLLLSSMQLSQLGSNAWMRKLLYLLSDEYLARANTYIPT